MLQSSYRKTTMQLSVTNWQIFPLLCVILPWFHANKVLVHSPYLQQLYRYITLWNQTLTFSLESQSDWADAETVEVMACSACNVDVLYDLRVPKLLVVSLRWASRRDSRWLPSITPCLYRPLDLSPTHVHHLAYSSIVAYRFFRWISPRV